MKSYFETTPISDLVIYHPPLFRDNRGYFLESYNQRHFQDQGINTSFVQDNRSYSQKGTLRGLHLQTGDAAQAKLVGVLSGKVFDVAVDLRKGSETFGQYFGLILDSTKDPCFFYIPRGFAHGFLVLSDAAEFYYKVDNFYSKENEAGIVFNDPELGIVWPEVDASILLSDKDKNLPSFNSFKQKFGSKD